MLFLENIKWFMNRKRMNQLSIFRPIAFVLIVVAWALGEINCWLGIILLLLAVDFNFTLK